MATSKDFTEDMPVIPVSTNYITQGRKHGRGRRADYAHPIRHEAHYNLPPNSMSKDFTKDMPIIPVSTTYLHNAGPKTRRGQGGRLCPHHQAWTSLLLASYCIAKSKDFTEDTLPFKMFGLIFHARAFFIVIILSIIISWSDFKS